MGKQLRTNHDWKPFDGHLCLVTSFSPLAKLNEQGQVNSPSLTTPYAFVSLRVEKGPEDISAIIAHKTDFSMLWVAFNNRAQQLPGVHVELNSFGIDSGKLPPLSMEGLGKDEEVWLVWTANRYRKVAGLLGGILPKLVVMVAPKGAFARNTGLDDGSSQSSQITGADLGIFNVPLLTMTPEVMTL